MSRPLYIDDNFGTWDIESQEDVDFYMETQRTNIEKVCTQCGRTVRIQPQYDICDSCATITEHGGGP